MNSRTGAVFIYALIGWMFSDESRTPKGIKSRGIWRAIISPFSLITILFPLYGIYRMIKLYRQKEVPVYKEEVRYKYDARYRDGKKAIGLDLVKTGEMRQLSDEELDINKLELRTWYWYWLSLIGWQVLILLIGK
jgi:hypothetical protein